MFTSIRSPIPLQEFDASDKTTNDAVSLPPEAFISDDFFNFEKGAIFAHEWLCIGRANDIPNKGDFFTIDLINEPLIAVRQADGSIKVMANVCRHRAMKVADGQGNARRFRCPYHSWVYGLNGALQSAPDLNENPCFDKSTISLPEIRSEIWQGFIFVTFDKDIPPISQRLESLTDYLRNWDLENLVSAEPLQFFDVEANWKVFGDECYHCAHLHSQSWCEMYDTSSEMIDYEASYNSIDQGVIGYNLVSLKPDLSPTRTGRNLQPILKGLTEEQRKTLVYATIAPNMLIIAMPDKVKYFLWYPTGTQTSVFAATWLYPQSTIDQDNFQETWKMEVEDLKQVMLEDIFAWESVQKGLRSTNAPRGRYAPSEVVLVRLNKWLINRYRNADLNSN
ncbi:Rieske 2Fe-2S domain-containing protein [Corynebacterium poyangense]|uniref:Rieske 2Fe-2S domain-containing protein n=1 Tax=Corynebacterium poyangense TaxID=2684405 RepID=A0A7H0SKX8_9CORY|nr:aromatic ring-hydroxylating dioxygenase subunit alpha [Corynebacterium poyangense]QNQ89203.1 Rieske 2Fe-2S domain-containing protein [Corynebacterium poyangense]